MDQPASSLHVSRPMAEQHWNPLVALIAIAALVLRLVHLWQIEHSPVSRWLIGDARAYDAWGQRIASGDWLGSEVFYQAPLYPYFLGVMYTLFGHDLTLVRLVQVFLGVGGCVLLALAGRAFFGSRAGLLAGGMLAVYPPAIFFDALIQKSALDLPLLALSLWLLAQARIKGCLRWWIAAGLSLGLLMLSRENALVFVGAAGLWALMPREGWSWRRGLRRGLALLAGVVIALGPVVVRNASISGELHVTTSQFGPNFYIGNNPQADGSYQPLRFGRGDALYERSDAVDLAQQRKGRTLTPGEVSSYWASQSFDFIREQPAAFLQLLGRKAMMTFNHIEITDTEGQYAYSDFSFVLRWLGWIGMGVLFPLGAAGAVLTWHRRQTHWLLLLSAGLYALSVIAFFVFARYRLPLVPLLILLASGGLTVLPELWRQKRWGQIGVAAAAMVVAGVMACWPVVTVANQKAVSYAGFANAAMQENPPDLELAQSYYDRAVELSPTYAGGWYNRGLLLLKRGQTADAKASFQRSVELRPGFADAWNQLGLLLAAQGDAPGASRAYEQALIANPTFAAAHNNLGVLLARQGQLAQAIHHYRQALAIDPTMHEAHNNLGTALARSGDLPAAAASFANALKIKPDYADAKANLQRARALLAE